MGFDPDDYRAALDRAHAHALEWLDSVPTRPVPPRKTAEELDFARPLQNDPLPANDVIDELWKRAEPGLMGMPSGRFFGWVIGGTLPAALGADWLVSAWDQNSPMRLATPAVAAIEGAAGTWLLELLGLPATSTVGFTTGATQANFAGLAAARHHVLEKAGWDVNALGLNGAPHITVLVGEERHASVDFALRYLGLGLPTPVAADDQGRIRIHALEEALSRAAGPVIVVLQAGNLHSGAFDSTAAIDLAHDHGAWVHVDGAFGLWAAASPLYAELLEGLDRADSWATDAHKTLNVPYDCGVAIIAPPGAAKSVFSMQTSYLIQDVEVAQPADAVPELSRRGRGVPVWAALRSLGRSGTIAMVERLGAHARSLATQLAALDGVEVLNDVVFTQVSLAFGSDERTRAVTAALIADGAVWMSGSKWRGRDILRISVSNWSTDEDDIAVAVDAVRRAMAAAAP